MLELTDAALTKLHDSLAAADRPEHRGKCFRIVPEDERSLTLRLAKPAPSDAIYEHDGDAVLALPKAIAEVVEGRQLDIDSDGKLKLV